MGYIRCCISKLFRLRLLRQTSVSDFYTKLFGAIERFMYGVEMLYDYAEI